MAIKKRKHISKIDMIVSKWQVSLITLPVFMEEIYQSANMLPFIYNNVSKPMKYNWNKVDGDKYNNKNDTLPVFCFFVSVIILLGERNTVFQVMYLSGKTCTSADISKGKPSEKYKYLNNRRNQVCPVSAVVVETPRKRK